MSTEFSLAQVAEHKKADDAYIVIHNKVYDVTSYISEDNHPGGIEVLKELSGGDATESFEDIGHSEEAREQLEALYKGDIVSGEAFQEEEVYRPDFKPLDQTPAVKLEPRSRSIVASGWQKAVQNTVLVSLGGALGAGYSTGRLQRANALLRAAFIRIIKRVSQRQGAVSTMSSGSSLSLWGAVIGFNVALAAGAVFWVFEHMDVQHSFTAYPAYRKRQDRVTIRRAPKVVRTKELAVQKSIDPLKWQKFPVKESKKLSHNVYHLTLALPRSDSILGLPTGQHIAIRATIDGKSVQRSYTPISNDSDRGVIEIVYKVYDKGLITNYLADRNVGDQVDVRGPKGAMTYAPGLTKELGMIAGGTGITPMYQIIRAICEDDMDDTTVTLLFANNTEEDILLGDRLDAWAAKYPNKFKLHHVITHPSKSWQGYTGFVTIDMIEKHLPRPNGHNSKILLCGPPPMVNAMKENLVKAGFERPGAISKKTDQVFMF